MAFQSGDADFDAFINRGDLRGAKRSFRSWISQKSDEEQERIRKIIQEDRDAGQKDELDQKHEAVREVAGRGEVEGAGGEDRQQRAEEENG